MPETDSAGVRERTAAMARGWPDYLDWQPTPAVEAHLNALCMARRDACDYPWTAVTDPAPPEVANTYDALRAALVEAGLPQRLAGWAADFTRLLDWMTVVECVRWTALPKPHGWLPLHTAAKNPNPNPAGTDNP